VEALDHLAGLHTSVLQLPLVFDLFLFAHPSFDVSDHVFCILLSFYPSHTPVTLALRLTTRFNLMSDNYWCGSFLLDHTFSQLLRATSDSSSPWNARATHVWSGATIHYLCVRAQVCILCQALLFLSASTVCTFKPKRYLTLVHKLA
jgi:hypothetical protein